MIVLIRRAMAALGGMDFSLWFSVSGWQSPFEVAPNPPFVAVLQIVTSLSRS